MANNLESLRLNFMTETKTRPDLKVLYTNTITSIVNTNKNGPDGWTGRTDRKVGPGGRPGQTDRTD